MRRAAAAVLSVLLAVDLGLLAWSVWRMVKIIQFPDQFIPGVVSDRVLAVMTVALGATYLVAIGLGGVDVAVLRRPPTRRATWFVLTVLAALLGLPDAVIVMLAGWALLLPTSVVLLMLAPAATCVAVVVTALAGLARPRPR